VAAPTSTQKLAVVLAFIAAAASFLAVVLGYRSQGTVPLAPLIGGLLMLVLGITGVNRLRQPPGGNPR
jgi:hypothetical protein